MDDEPEPVVQGATVTAPEGTISDELRDTMADWTFRYGVPDASAIQAGIAVVSAATSSGNVGEVSAACRSFGVLITRIKSHPAPALPDLAAEYGAALDHFQEASAFCTEGALNSHGPTIKRATDSFKLGGDALKKAIALAKEYGE